MSKAKAFGVGKSDEDGNLRNRGSLKYPDDCRCMVGRVKEPIADESLSVQRVNPGPAVIYLSTYVSG